MEAQARTTLAVVVVVVVIAVPVALLFVAGGGDEPEPARGPAADAWLEPAASSPGLTVFVRPAINTPARAGGASEIELRCEDPSGRLVIAQDEGWPFTGTDPLARGPHTHVSLPPDLAADVRRCRLIGTRPELRAARR